MASPGRGRFLGYSFSVSPGVCRVDREEDGTIRLEKNDRYWNKQAIRTSVIEALAIEDPERALARFEKGDVHWLPNWPVALRYAAKVVGLLRRAIREQPPDLFVERLRTLWLTEVISSARFLGRFRRARLERFFVELTDRRAVAGLHVVGVDLELRLRVDGRAGRDRFLAGGNQSARGLAEPWAG